MRFTAKTEEQIAQGNLIPDGTYNFRVEAAQNKFSKNGNEMIELQLTIWDHENKQRVLTDYLVEAIEYKLRHFCTATGLLSVYEANELNDVQCVGKTGNVEIGRKKGKDDDRYWNVVKDYVAPSQDGASGPNEPIPPKAAVPFNDDIPF